MLEIVLSNRSDAHFRLKNLTGFSLVHNYDLIEVAPHTETTLRIRTGDELERVTLDFEVLNALTAPNRHPVVSFEWTVD